MNFKEKQYKVNGDYINSVFPEGDVRHIMGFTGYNSIGDVITSENLQKAGDLIKDVGIITAEIKKAGSTANTGTVATTQPTVAKPAPTTTNTKPASYTWLWVSVGSLAAIGIGILIFKKL